MTDEWVKHDGSECPFEDGSKVDVKFRGMYACNNFNVKDLRWGWNEHGGGDIVEYKLSSGKLKEKAVVSEAVKDTNPKDAIGVRKAPMSTVPMNVIAEIGVAMLEGASKYGRHNYRAMGVRSSVYFDATMRHLMDWWEGVDIDPDSGMSHITKAITSLTVLRDAQMQGMCTDDRPPRSKDFYSHLNKTSGEIIDKYKDKKPKHYTLED